MDMKKQSGQPIVGNEKIVKFLQRLVNVDQAQQLSGSYIFAGPSHVGKTAMASFFLQSLLCKQQTMDHQPCQKCQTCRQLVNGSYADLVEVKLEEGKRDISIEQIRILINKLKMSSFANSYKIGVIHQADALNNHSANALLKTLEEPNRKVLIFLITNNLDSLPQTIVSRSQVMQFAPVPTEVIYNHLVKHCELKRSQALNLAHLSAGRPGLAVELLENPEKVEKNLQIADVFLSAYRQDVNQRLAGLEKIVNKLAGQEGVETARQIINIWQHVQRDIWLARYQQEDLVHYSNFLSKLEDLKVKITKHDLINAQHLLNQAKQYLFSNVNPRIVLENVMINI